MIICDDGFCKLLSESYFPCYNDTSITCFHPGLCFYGSTKPNVRVNKKLFHQ